MKSNAQTLGKRSDNYAAHRPSYPAALIEWVAAQAPTHNSAWDCATGNGQAAKALANHFGTVYATDISAGQVAAAINVPNVHFSVAPAEASGLADNSVDLVTVAQALHWFDFDIFWDEVRRVAKPGAFFCAWGYDWLRCPAEMNSAFMEPFKAILEPYWAPENAILWNGFPRDVIRFPFKEVAAPEFTIKLAFTTRQLLDYLETWSAYKLARQTPELAAELDALMASAAERFGETMVQNYSMPLHMVAGPVA